MGWLKASRLDAQAVTDKFSQDLKLATQHVEAISLDQEPTLVPISPVEKLKYPFVPTSVPDDDLPFIPASEVTAKQRPSSASASPFPTSNLSKPSSELWIVIDNIVFDCSTFVSTHPGGEQVIESFRGQECSWQFWRFHGKDHMAEFGRPLRVGRTAGVGNRYVERPKWVGSGGFDDMDEWD
ncbi:MAG: hypothetical protein M1827_007580 [Pycnora praestabilis]|nr:MAG: hypothetical protein M1827_007580 [Pycnora praestabilis]